MDFTKIKTGTELRAAMDLWFFTDPNTDPPEIAKGTAMTVLEIWIDQEAVDAIDEDAIERMTDADNLCVELHGENEGVKVFIGFECVTLP